MKKIISYRNENYIMNYKTKTNILTNSINKKIKKDIYHAKTERLNGNIGTPIEEVLNKMKKIIKGETL